jgi:hypothetical protein
VAAAVKVGGRDDLVARFEQRRDRDRLRGQPAGRRQRADTALQARHPLLEHCGRRVHDPGVDVAEAVQVEQVGGVLRVLEDIRDGLVDRRRPRSRHRVDALPGMHGQGVEPELVEH